MYYLKEMFLKYTIFFAIFLAAFSGPALVFGDWDGGGRPGGGKHHRGPGKQGIGKHQGGPGKHGGGGPRMHGIRGGSMEKQGHWGGGKRGGFGQTVRGDWGGRSNIHKGDFRKGDVKLGHRGFKGFYGNRFSHRDRFNNSRFFYTRPYSNFYTYPLYSHPDYSSYSYYPTYPIKYSSYPTYYYSYPSESYIDDTNEEDYEDYSSYCFYDDYGNLICYNPENNTYYYQSANGLNQ